MEDNFDKILSVLKEKPAKKAKNLSFFSNSNVFFNFYFKHRLYLNFAILALFFFINCFSPYVSYIVFPILVIMSIADNLENGLAYIMFSIPFCLLYPFVSMIIYVCAVVLYVAKFCYLYFVVEKGKMSFATVFFVGLFVLYALFQFQSYSKNTFFKIFLILAIYIALFAISRWKTFKATLYVRVLAFSLILSSIFGLLIFVSPYLQTIINLPVQGSLFRFQALMSNTNAFAMLCEISLALLAYSSIKEKKCLINFILFLGVAIAGFFTFSKLFYITLLVTLIFFFIGMMFVDWKKTLIVTSITLIVGGIVFAIIYSQRPEFFQKILARFGDFSGSLDENMNEFTTTRWTLWKGTFAYWAKNPLVFFFGRGLGASPIPGLPFSAHNLYISCIDQLGIFGTLLFVAPIFLLVRDIAKHKKISAAIMLPVAVLAIMFMAEDMLFYIFPF